MYVQQLSHGCARDFSHEWPVCTKHTQAHIHVCTSCFIQCECSHAQIHTHPLCPAPRARASRTATLRPACKECARHACTAQHCTATTGTGAARKGYGTSKGLKDQGQRAHQPVGSINTQAPGLHGTMHSAFTRRIHLCCATRHTHLLHHTEYTWCHAAPMCATEESVVQNTGKCSAWVCKGIRVPSVQLVQLRAAKFTGGWCTQVLVLVYSISSIDGAEVHDKAPPPLSLGCLLSTACSRNVVRLANHRHLTLVECNCMWAQDTLVRKHMAGKTQASPLSSPFLASSAATFIPTRPPPTITTSTCARAQTRKTPHSVPLIKHILCLHKKNKTLAGQSTARAGVAKAQPEQGCSSCMCRPGNKCREFEGTGIKISQPCI